MTFQPTVSPWPLLNALHGLAMANLQLLFAPGACAADSSGATTPFNLLTYQTHLLQGMAENYARCMSEWNADALTVFSGTRSMLVSIAADE